ncbi:N-acyl homoserine lactonase family protein [Acidiferrobacter sp.]|uniref:N-acyl homoserine lactonase family protein n=1 Tax=Acidiferrobacter sp. TaxID=1872107 RepID=UPI00260DC687|nr:N-acyl homoserine lactonase family protein [Acidiferrobacter sp.]
MALSIHPISTGQVRIKNAQLVRRSGGPVRVMSDHDWSEWLPIHVWLIDHPEGLILVDTGETMHASDPGHFPRWHPYYRRAAAFAIDADQEVGPALARLGVRAGDIRTVLLTHLHTDHAGGLGHLRDSTVWVSAPEWRIAQGWGGVLRGYGPRHFPPGFAPRFYDFSGPPLGPFAQTCAVTRARDVIVVPTPGHTPGHVSVIVRAGGRSYFLAGDASYTEAALSARAADGVTFTPRAAKQTLDRIALYARYEPTVYLPTHDLQSVMRLRDTVILSMAPG